MSCDQALHYVGVLWPYLALFIAGVWAGVMLMDLPKGGS